MNGVLDKFFFKQMKHTKFPLNYIPVQVNKTLLVKKIKKIFKAKKYLLILKFIFLLGIDDISFSVSLSCYFSPNEAQPILPDITTKIITSTVTTPDTSIKELDCDFETTNCQWFNSPNNTKANWTIYKVADNKNQYSPSIDHTLGNDQGSYLSLNSDAYFPKANVLFQSPLMNGTKCVAFWLVINQI